MKKFNVLVWNNGDKPVAYDVLPYFRNRYKKLRKKDRPSTEEQWREFITRSGMYMYWARCEYEIIILPWPNQDKHVKIDVWQQIENNIDLIIDILMNEKL